MEREYYARSSVKELTVLRLGDNWDGRRRPRDRATERLFERNVVTVERLAGGAIELHPGLAVRRHGRYVIRLRLGEIALRQNHVIDGRGAQFILLLLGIHGLLLAHARLLLRLITGTRLLHTDHGVLHLDAHLVFEPLQPDLLLPPSQFIGRDVVLRGTAADLNIPV